MSFDGEMENKVMRLAFTREGNERRFVEVTSDAIANLIRHYAVRAKEWEVRANIEMTCGMKEFWTPHGRVRVESVVSDYKCFELREGA